jgi:hypothetical protein
MKKLRNYRHHPTRTPVSVLLVYFLSYIYLLSFNSEIIVIYTLSIFWLICHFFVWNSELLDFTDKTYNFFNEFSQTYHWLFLIPQKLRSRIRCFLDCTNRFFRKGCSYVLFQKLSQFEIYSSFISHFNLLVKSLLNLKVIRNYK